MHELPPLTDLRNPNGTATRWDLVVVFDAVIKLMESERVVPGSLDPSARAELIKQLNVR